MTLAMMKSHLLISKPAFHLMKQEAIAVLDRSLATEPVITSSTCPDACRNALSSLSSEFGCSYQSIHNDTRYFDAKIVNEQSNFPERGFWLAIRNPVQ